MNKSSYFVAGIGTDVGKTIASAILCNVLDMDYWKPVQTGNLAQHDRFMVEKYQTNPLFKIHPESYSFNEPLSPHIASTLEGDTIELKTIELPQTNRGILAEGAGGVLVPLNWHGHTNIDLIKRLNLPVILVSKHYLGSINHTLLSVEMMKQKDIAIKGIVYVGEEIQGTKQIIETISKIPTLFEIPLFENLSPSTIHAYLNDHREEILNSFS